MFGRAFDVSVRLAGRCSVRACGERDVKLNCGIGRGISDEVRLGAGIEVCNGWVGKTRNRVGRQGCAGTVAVGSDGDGGSNTDCAEGEDGEDGCFH